MIHDFVKDQWRWANMICENTKITCDASMLDEYGALTEVNITP